MRTVNRALTALALFAPLPVQAASTYYVAPKGSDSAAGTEAAPWASIAHAQASAGAGDTIYIRGGTYSITAGTNTCSGQTSTVNAIALTKSGTAGNLIKYWAYPGETPVFDFSGLMADCRVKGFDVTGNYIHLKGITVTGVKQRNNQNHESWGVWISGSNNVFELLDIFHIDGTGLFIQNGSDNLVSNCDSHENFDPLTSNGACESGDGFGAHVSANNPGNVFRGCRAWFNSDDDFDLINAFSVVTIENCWAWHAGYRYDTGASCGNGNGFKGGGYGTDTSKFPANPPVHVLRNNLSVGNKAAGFYANHHPGTVTFYNNTSYGNHPDFNMLGMSAAGADITVGKYRNNLAVGGTLTSNATKPDDENNSWTVSVTASTADFSNTSETGLDAPRQADGSLPVIENFHLVAGSDLIDRGVDVGLGYNGSAPDLGCFETGGSTGGSSGTGGSRATGGATVGAGGSGGSSVGGAGITAGSLGMGGNRATDVTTQAFVGGTTGTDPTAPNAGGHDSASQGGLGSTGTTDAHANLGGSTAAVRTASDPASAHAGGNNGGATPTASGNAAGASEGNSDGCSCRILAESRAGSSFASLLTLLGLAFVRARRRPLRAKAPTGRLETFVAVPAIASSTRGHRRSPSDQNP